MSDCHRRIERFLEALTKVAAGAQGGSLDAEHRHALDASLKYFRHSAPKHTADEEEDLFPLLRNSERPELQPLMARVDLLEREHKKADGWHREVDEIGERWLQQDHLSPEETARLQELLTSLSDLYRTHLAIEDREVFPAAREALSRSEAVAIGRKMASRRGVLFVPEEAPPASL
jgi:hemerythrin-like domain-containing protein